MSDPVSLRLPVGELVGARADGVVRFRAVPYAAPPTGARRFAPPAPVVPWDGPRDVRAHGPIAPQPSSRLRLAMGDFTRAQDEDCLTLAIATPGLDAARRPVIIWLHGGAFLSGAGSLGWYDGGPLAAAGDVVVVGVNYRLGPLGFLHHPGLADGIMGFRDIIAALRFVQAHIAAFGGDPDCVTLMGQSAGGAATLRLLAMEETRGLFHRAIVQSGPPRPGVTGAVATTRARRLMELAGIDPDAPDAAGRLRAAPATELVTLQMQIARENARFGDPDPAFPPVFDDFGSTEAYCTRLARNAAERGLDIMLGTTREEMHAFYMADPAMAEPDPAKVAERFATLAGSADAMAAYRRRRPGADLRALLAELVADHRFLFPTLTLADHLADAGRAGFLYQFDWSPAGSPWQACHCIELPFMFGTRAHWDAPMLAGASEAEIDALSRTMMTAWTNFARTGSPGISDFAWPRYARDRRLTMVFGAVTGVVGDPAGAGRRPGRALLAK